MHRTQLPSHNRTGRAWPLSPTPEGQRVMGTEEAEVRRTACGKGSTPPTSGTAQERGSVRRDAFWFLAFCVRGRDCSCSGGQENQQSTSHQQPSDLSDACPGSGIQVFGAARRGGALKPLKKDCNQMNNKQRKLSKHNQEVRQSLACSDFEVTAPFSSDYIVMGGVGTFSHPNFRVEWTLGR